MCVHMWRPGVELSVFLSHPPPDRVSLDLEMTDLIGASQRAPGIYPTPCNAALEREVLTCADFTQVLGMGVSGEASAFWVLGLKVCATVATSVFSGGPFGPVLCLLSYREFNDTHVPPLLMASGVFDALPVFYFLLSHWYYSLF